MHAVVVRAPLNKSELSALVEVIEVWTLTFQHRFTCGTTAQCAIEAIAVSHSPVKGGLAYVLGMYRKWLTIQSTL